MKIVKVGIYYINMDTVHYAVESSDTRSVTLHFGGQDRLSLWDDAEEMRRVLKEEVSNAHGQDR